MKYFKNGILFGLGVFLLFLPLLLLSGSSLRVYLAEPTATPTAHPLLAAACDYPSPNGRFCGAVLDGVGVKVSDENGRILFSEWVKWSQLVGWTNDSRFVFFNNHDQYGNSQAIRVDTEQWEINILGEDVSCWGAGTKGDCRRGVVALAPQNGLALQGFGRIYDLTNQAERDLFANPEASIIWVAAWSPDEAKLAFLGSADKEAGEVTLFIADGNGESVTAVSEFTFATSDLFTPRLHWADDQTIGFQDNRREIYWYQIEKNEES